MDEVIRIGIDTGDSATRIEELKRKLDEMKAALAEARKTMSAADADKLFGNMGAEFRAVHAELRTLQAAAAPATQAVEGVSQAVREVGKSADQAAGSAARTFGQLTVGIGRFAQDFQAGLANGGIQGAIRAVNNNLEELGRRLAQLGGASPALAGLAGGLTQIGGVILQATLPAIEDFIRSLAPKAVADFREETDQLKTKLKELTDKPIKLDADYKAINEAEERIKALTRAKAALDRIMGAQTEAERESGQEVEKAIVKTPGGREAIARQIIPGVQAEKLADDRELARFRMEADKAAGEAKAAERHVGGAATQEEAQIFLDRAAQARAREQEMRGKAMAREGAANEEARLAVGELLDQAVGGTGAKLTGAQAELRKRLAGAGQVGLADTIGNRSPEAVEENKAAKEADKEAKEEERAAKEATRAAAAAEHEVAKARLQEFRKLGRALAQQEREDKEAGRETAKDKREQNRAIAGRGADEMARAAQIAAANRPVMARPIDQLIGELARGQFTEAQTREIAGQRVANQLQMTGQASNPLQARIIANNLIGPEIDKLKATGGLRFAQQEARENTGAIKELNKTMQDLQRNGIPAEPILRSRGSGRSALRR